MTALLVPTMKISPYNWPFRYRMDSVSMMVCCCMLLSCIVSRAHTDVTDFAFGDPEVINLPKGASPSCIAIADIDGDGDLDAVLSGRNVDGMVVILDGTPDGSLVVSGELVAPSQTDWVELADVDEDGHLDAILAIRDQAGAVAIFRGSSQGGFEEVPDVLKVGREIRWIDCVDIDGDGHLDLVLLGHLTEDVIVLRGDGDGGFDQASRLRLSPWNNGKVYPQSMTIIDLDGDGHLDAAPVTIGTRNLQVSKGDGSGMFGSARAWEPPLVNNEAGGCAYAAASDFDGDGLLEFILPQTTWGQQWFVLFELDSNGAVTGRRAIQASQWGVSWIPEAADFDLDGDIDIVIGHALPGVVTFMENIGRAGEPASFLEPQWFFAGEFIRNMKAIDIDMDGDQDLLALDFTGDAVLLFRNGQVNGFASGNDRSAPIPPHVHDRMNGMSGAELARWLSDVDPEELRSFLGKAKGGAAR